MFDLGVMRCDAVKYLTTFRNCIEPCMSTIRIENVIDSALSDQDYLYKMAMHFVHGFYDYYCEQNDLDDLDLLYVDDDAREYLLKWFLMKFINIYESEFMEFSDFTILDFAFACMIGKKVCPEFEHKFSVYFWNFYTQFEKDVLEFYRERQELLSGDE